MVMGSCCGVGTGMVAMAVVAMVTVVGGRHGLGGNGGARGALGARVTAATENHGECYDLGVVVSSSLCLL